MHQKTVGYHTGINRAHFAEPGFSDFNAAGPEKAWLAGVLPSGKAGKGRENIRTHEVPFHDRCEG